MSELAQKYFDQIMEAIDKDEEGYYPTDPRPNFNSTLKEDILGILCDLIDEVDSQ